ncbi:MAG: ABC transporter permease [Opitutaceae bacterium]
MIRGVYAMVLLDLKRAWVDRVRLVFGLAQPLLYLFVLGAGLGADSRMAVSYRAFIFPGVIGLNLLFSATFAAIAIVFDRQIGFLKAVFVAPIPRSAVALGKIASGGLQSFCQALLILPFAPLVGVRLGPLPLLELVVAMLAASLVFSAMGVAVAARFTSTTVFPIVSNAVLLPMFFLSGALYPLQVAPHWMRIAALFDPVTYAIDLMRGAILPTRPAPPITRFLCPPAFSMAALAVFIGILAWAAIRIFSRGEDDSSLGASRFVWRRR